MSTDEEKVKGCLCLTPAMLETSEENTKDSKEDVVPAESNVTSPRETQIVTDVTDPEVNESTQTINNLTSAMNVPSENEEFSPPAMLEQIGENTKQKSVYVKTDLLPNQSNVNSPRQINLFDKTPTSIRSKDESIQQDNDLTATEDVYRNINLNDCVPSVNMDNLKMLTLLDFAGHSAYYACHHIFFSPRAFFILVVDMTKDLRSVATEACPKKGLIYSDWTYAGRLL